MSDGAPEEKKKKVKANQIVVAQDPKALTMTLAQKRKSSQDAAVVALAKKYGAGSIGAVTSMTYAAQPRIPSGIFILDYALGGGWARGRVNVIWGNRSSSKTTSVLRAIANAQQMDLNTNKFIFELEGAERERAIPLKCAFIDVEGTFDRLWAMALGVDVDALMYARPQSAEEAAEIMEIFLKKDFDVVALDSIAAMIPQVEVEGGIEDHNVGVQARIMSKLFRKIQSAINTAAKEDPMRAPTVLMLNQVRNKIGVMFGSPDVKPGGLAQDFYSTIEVKFSASKMVYYDGKEKMLPKHIDFSFDIVKNKVSPPKIHGSYSMQLVTDDDIDLRAGQIDELKEVFKFAEKLGIYAKDPNGKGFLMYGNLYKTKGEVIDAFYMDKDRYLVLKRDILTRLIPKQ